MFFERSFFFSLEVFKFFSLKSSFKYDPLWEDHYAIFVFELLGCVDEYFSSNWTFFFKYFFLLLSFWVQLHKCWCNWMALHWFLSLWSFNFSPTSLCTITLHKFYESIVNATEHRHHNCSKFSKSPSVFAGGC